MRKTSMQFINIIIAKRFDMLSFERKCRREEKKLVYLPMGSDDQKSASEKKETKQMKKVKW